jgi:hypothetical protein
MGEWIYIFLTLQQFEVSDQLKAVAALPLGKESFVRIA